MDEQKPTGNELGSQSDSVVDCDTKPKDANLNSVADKISGYSNEGTYKSSESPIVFRQPDLPIKFKKPPAKKSDVLANTASIKESVALNTRSSELSTNVETTCTENDDDEKEATADFPISDVKKQAANGSQGIKTIPVPYKVCSLLHPRLHSPV